MGGLRKLACNALPQLVLERGKRRFFHQAALINVDKRSILSETSVGKIEIYSRSVQDDEYEKITGGRSRNSTVNIQAEKNSNLSECRYFQVGKMKLDNLEITNFRSFAHFRMKSLGRLNLIVGTNNSGKTTVLEAVQILMANNDFASIWSTLSRRGEDIWVEKESFSTSSRQVEIRRLFHNHEMEVGSNFQITARTEFGKTSMAARIEEYRPAQPLLFDTDSPPPDSAEDDYPPLALSLSWSNGHDREMSIPMSRRGGIASDFPRRNPTRFSTVESSPLRLVTASSLTQDTVTSLFEQIVLTPEEDLVTEAMRIIEPSIDRIASAGSEKSRFPSRYSNRGGILVRMKNSKDRLPIGSMGDGIWRMLGLALSVVQTADGILLVDEIDTGLHHSTMKKMWEFLYICAKKYNVQILATTHSRDCYQSLSVICRDFIAENSEVTIQRVEKGRIEAVLYSEQEIIAAAERDIEVR